MAIPLGQPVDQINHVPGGIRIGVHKEDSLKREMQGELLDRSGSFSSSEAASVHQNEAASLDEHSHPGDAGSSSGYPSEVSSVGQSEMAALGVHGHPSDATSLNTSREEYLDYAASNAFVPLQVPTYTGYPVPVMDFHGYMPHAMEGVYYHHPVVEYNVVNNQPLYGSIPAEVQYIAQDNIGYVPVYMDPHYQLAPAGQYTAAGHSLPEPGMVLLEPQDPAVIMSSGYTIANQHVGQAMPMAMVGPPVSCDTVTVPVAFSYSPTYYPGMLRASAPAWIQQPPKPKGLKKGDNLVASQPINKPSLLKNFAPAGKFTLLKSTPVSGIDSKSLSQPSRAGGCWQYIQKGMGTCLSNAEHPTVPEYNLADFLTEYDGAKHFIIKSFSEENIYRSIQHGVWASTPNGNKKLDAAFQDAQCRAAGKANGCPVFLFFSVNGSGRFCGVAEMLGPLDYNKTMDFWERNKWNGSFRVKWHIIKDVPNCQLRRIVLQNNENKPVTSSRDTQEVNHQQGLEMLNIFKNYCTRASILDNFPGLPMSQAVVSDVKPQQSSPWCLAEMGGEVNKGQAQEPCLKGVQLSSNALRACNSGDKRREIYSQGKSNLGMEDTAIQNPNGDKGGRKPDKENITISGIDVVAAM